MIPQDLLHRPTSEEINAMPLKSYGGPVHIIHNATEWRRALRDLGNDSVLGFDTETRPSFKKGRVNSPSLIQLATAQSVYLIQLGNMPFGAEVADLLSRPDIIKAGVGVQVDMQALAKIYPFTPAGIVDLGHVAEAHNMPSHGLRTLAATMFGWRISKGSQCSNWSLRKLTPRQIAYAATDAWIGRMIYMRMLELGMLADANVC